MKKIVVIGAGTMGSGIAQVFAQIGCTVILIDNNETQKINALKNIEKSIFKFLAKGIFSSEKAGEILQHIHINRSLSKETLMGIDLVVEAIAEDEKIKGNLFKNLSEIAESTTILASNTSSISIQKIAAYTNCADRVIGMHFMNPVPIMKLVEIITTHATSNNTLQKIVDITIQLKKEPCIVKDYPGFIANRILMPLINEAILSVEAEIASISTIDTICKLGFSHPMGPLQLADFIGLDICSNILQIMEKDFNNVKYRPSTLLIKMIEKGYLGKKSGMGFYDYTLGGATLIENKNILN